MPPPNDAATQSRTPQVTALLEAACAALHDDPVPPVAAVAAQVGVSASYLHRVFRRELGLTPGAYRRRVLRERAKHALGGQPSVTDAALTSGWSSVGSYDRAVGEELGMAPRVALAWGEGQALCFETGTCTLGWVLVGWTPRGVAVIELGDSEEEVVAAAHARYLKASWQRGEDAPWLQKVVEAADDDWPLELPLHVRGTAFQEAVWRVLQAIPSGQTRTYGQVANALSRPKAVRAVASACARNPVALAIPCHRVVRSDGSLAGYRWGVHRKRQRLAQEASASEGPALGVDEAEEQGTG